MRLLYHVAAATMLSASLSAHADTLSTFAIHGASIFSGFGDSNVVNGKATIDVTTGVVQSISFTVGGLFESSVDTQVGSVIYVGGNNEMFSLSAASLINFSGENFNLRTANDLYVGQVNLLPAAITAAEPSTLVLLGTGLLGTLGAARRKFSASR